VRGVGALGTYRITWECTPDTQEAAEGMLAFAQAYAEHQLGRMRGMHFVLSALTGVTTNKKGREGDAQTPATVKPGIGFIVCYSPTENTSDEAIVDKLHHLGFTVADPEVKQVQGRGNQEGGEDAASLNSCCIVLKDCKTDYIRDLFERSVEYVGAAYPNITLNETPLHIYTVNPNTTDIVRNLVTQLSRLSIRVSMDSWTPDGHEQRQIAYNSVQKKGVDKSLEVLLDFTVRNKFAIRQGRVYCLVPGASFTMVAAYTVEAYVHKCLENAELKSKISVTHLKALWTTIGHKDFSMIPQLTIDQDLIEVNGGKCWHLPSMSFINTPLTPQEFGRKSPRAFAPLNPNVVPEPTHFIETVRNSFPEPDKFAHFITKWYQLLFSHRHLMKLRCLLVHGVKDCGKTSIVNPILGVIPTECVASITCERNQFATSMLTENTELTFVDEFTEDRLDADTAKNVLQGGFTVTAVKHTAARVFNNKTLYYFTAQHCPNWGADDVNVKRRLAVFEMKPLPSTSVDVSKWLKDNAVACIIWAGVMVKRGVDDLPLSPAERRDELFFTCGTVHTLPNQLVVDHVGTCIQRYNSNLSVEPEIADNVHELFNDEEDNNDPADSQRNSQQRQQPPPHQQQRSQHHQQQQSQHHHQHQQQQQQQSQQDSQHEELPSSHVTPPNSPIDTVDTHHFSLKRFKDAHDGAATSCGGQLTRSQSPSSPSPRKQPRGVHERLETRALNPFANLVVADDTNINNMDPADEESDASDIEGSFTVGDIEGSFTNESVKSDSDYLRCVRRCLMENLNMSSPNEVDLSRWLVRRDNLERKRDYLKADVMFDAWSCVLGKCRPVFPVATLLAKYPRLKQKIVWLRKAMNVRMRTVEADEI
jgi:hypothetical protein